MKQERRRPPRGRLARGLKVRVTSAEPQARDFNHADRVLDVGPRGLCLVTVGRLRMGIRVAVEVLSPSGRVGFSSGATVAWSTTVESRGRTAHVAGLHLDRSLVQEPRKKSPPAPKRLLPSRAPEPQRAHKRFVPQEVEIACLPRGVLRTMGLARNTGRRLKDLSLGGAQIVCSRKLRPGQAVDLRLEFKHSKLTVEAEGVVRWCRRDTASLEPRFLAGVVFKGLPEGSERSLRAIERAFLGF